MSNPLKDTAKEAHATGTGNYTSLNADFHLRSKVVNQSTDPNTFDFKPFWEMTVNDQKRHTDIPVYGILIGQANIGNSYNDKTKDSCFTLPFFSNKQIVLFYRPANGKARFVHKGTKEECDNHSFQLIGKKLGTKKQYYVAGKTKEGAKIFCLEGSIVMAIELQKKINPSFWEDYCFTFTPTLFDREGDWSKDCKEALQLYYQPNKRHEQLAYIAIAQSDPIDEDIVNYFSHHGVNIKAEMENYIKWKKEQGANVQKEDQVNNTFTTTEDQSPAPTTEYIPMPETEAPSTNAGNEWPNDLPF